MTMKSPIGRMVMFFTLAQVSGLLCAPAQPAPSEAKAGGPRIKFPEPVVDFGKVNSSDLVRHDFIVMNAGDAVLEITEVTASCGCTVAGAWDRRIQPGRTGKIPIRFSPGTLNGPVLKVVTVTSNDPTQPTQALQIQAVVWHPIEIQPAGLYFSPPEGEEINDTKVARIVSNLDVPLVLESPRNSNAAFKAELKEIVPGKEFELRVTYAGVIGKATLQNQVTIKTSSREIPLLKLNTAVMPQPAIAAIPAEITLTPAQVATGHRHGQMILNNGSTPLKVTGASVNGEGISIDITEPKPGKLFMVNVTFPPSLQVGTRPPLELTVRTSDPKYPVITIPINAAPQKPVTPAASTQPTGK